MTRNAIGSVLAADRESPMAVDGISWPTSYNEQMWVIERRDRARLPIEPLLKLWVRRERR
jgi:hypothetical protein